MLFCFHSVLDSGKEKALSFKKHACQGAPHSAARHPKGRPWEPKDERHDRRRPSVDPPKPKQPTYQNQPKPTNFWNFWGASNRRFCEATERNEEWVFLKTLHSKPRPTTKYDVSGYQLVEVAELHTAAV